MIISIDRLTEVQQRNAIERAERLAPTVTITERADGHVRADVECNGSCGARQFHDGKHDVVLRWDGILTCNCPTVHSVCYHAAALLAHEGGAFPEKPKDCGDFGCGQSPLYYTWDGNGHAPTCPSFGDPDDRYELDATRLGRRVAAALAPAARNVVPMSDGRQRAINKTRPRLRIDGDRVVIRRPCGCVAWEGRLSDQGDFALPLSPSEGCPEHYDHMQPPAPDQVRARQEAL